MKTCNFVISLGFIAFSAAFAQGPMYDKVTVSLPYPVTVNGTILQPGDYVIRQHEDQSGSRVLHFFTNEGMKLETTAMAIPTLDNRTPEHTKLVLDHEGDTYFLHKIWVQGKNYGYEFPIPSDIRRREMERNAPAAVVAQYTQQHETTETTVAQTQPKQEVKTEERTEIAQVTPPPAPAPEPTPAPAPAPVVREQAEQAPAPAEPVMPHTAGNWLNLALGGSLLAASGLALRRVRA
jgi:Predicted membrane protein